MYADDLAIVGGLGRLDDRPVMIIGHQKGRDTKERVRRNYGMPKPEGYRKALRLMRLAERFALPLVTLIDTQGAYPGVGAEERGQSEAIARNLFEMSVLSVPIITVVTGEGGSGGALAIGVCDRLLMLQYSTYSVISPEGCASILWKSQDKKEAAADALNLTADRLGKLGLVDEVVEEPLGGAHRDPVETAAALSRPRAIIRHLDQRSRPCRTGSSCVQRRSSADRTRSAISPKSKAISCPRNHSARSGSHRAWLSCCRASPTSGWLLHSAAELIRRCCLRRLAAVSAAGRSALPTFRVRAVHVNHGIHPNAVNWAAHCRSLARGASVVPLAGSERLASRDTPGESAGEQPRREMRPLCDCWLTELGAG